MTILNVKDLTVSFNTPAGMVRAVRGVSFSLNKGETLCIVGESGSGKSITCRAIMGILAANAVVEKGVIEYKEKKLSSERDFHNVRGSKIGMIFQDPLSSLNPIMKIGHQITEALRLRKNIPCKKGIRRMSKVEAKKRALELMEEVGIPKEKYSQYPFQFSGGMRQRIVIAIALAMNPEILICDEPTTALDVTIQSQILELINRLKQERKLSIIFITHDLGVVANMADYIAVMYAGKIVEYGKCEEIFYNPRHPYTWALLSSMPSLEKNVGRLEPILGVPPNLLQPIVGDAFAPRNKYALNIDFKQEPPFFKVSDTHKAATWLLHPSAPYVVPFKLEKEGEDSDE